MAKGGNKALIAIGAKVAKSLPQSVDKAKTMFAGLGDSAKKACELTGKAAKISAAAIGAGAAAMVGITKKALDAAGELEQNIGGSEAVFGSYAADMQKTASAAFDKMGLSASDYLATANKMGALFKGSGFETSEAMQMTSEAMQRAADVASIMGIDVSAAMEAVAGAAKGNFTMMDNLGVAINDTAIKQYALSKKMKINTKAMTTQQKVAIAMEMFLDKSAYAAGNYAKENETLAGSLTTAKAAWGNFLSGAGDGKQLAGALANAAKVVTKNITAILPGLVEGIGELIDGLSAELPGLMEALIPGVMVGAVSLVKGVAKSLPQIIGAIGKAAPSVITALFGDGDASAAAMEALDAIKSSVAPIISDIADGFSAFSKEILPKFAKAFEKIAPLISDIAGKTWELFKSVSPIFEAIGSVIGDLCSDVLPVLIDVFGGVVSAITGILKPLAPFIAKIIKGVGNVISWFADALSGKEVDGSKLVGAVINILAGIGGAVIALVKSLLKTLWSLVCTVFTALGRVLKGLFKDLWAGIVSVTKAAWSGITGFFKNLWDGIVNVAKAAWSGITGFFKNLWEGIVNTAKSIWGGITGFFKGLWDGICGIVQGFIDWVKNNWQSIVLFIINPFIGIFSYLYNNFEGFRNFVNGVVQSIANFFSGLWSGICSGVTSAAEWISSTWSSIVTTIGDFVSGFGTAVADAFKGVINVAIGWVQNLINGFIDGINLAIDLINAIPGVNIPLLATVNLPMLAKGGIATAPTLAMIGEGRENEAVMPLSKLSAMLDEAREGGGAPKSGENESTVINFSPKIEIKGDADERTVSEAMKMSFEEFKKLMEAYKRERRRKDFAY